MKPFILKSNATYNLSELKKIALTMNDIYPNIIIYADTDMYFPKGKERRKAKRMLKKAINERFGKGGKRGKAQKANKITPTNKIARTTYTKNH